MCSVTQWCLSLCDPMDCSHGVCGIFQARILERVDICNSKGSSQLSSQTCVSCVSCEEEALHHLGSPPLTIFISKITKQKEEVDIGKTAIASFLQWQMSSEREFLLLLEMGDKEANTIYIWRKRERNKLNKIFTCKP